MLPPAVVEQQAKLGVSAEESKALRLQRQQARFRDRGGAFKPSDANPLVDILLARTVSGESPSRMKRQTPSKTRQASPRRKSKVGTKVNENVTMEGEAGNAIAGSSKAVAPPAKSRKQTSNKRKSKAAETELDTAAKPGPKRRGRPPKSRETAPEPDSDVERPPPMNAKSKSTSKDKRKGTGKGKRKDTAPTTSTSETKVKPKAKPKAKQKLPEKIVEVLVSDDDTTLVEAPHKPTSSSKPTGKGKARKKDEEEDEDDEDAPIVKHAKPSSKVAAGKGLKTEKAGISGKKKRLEEEEDQTERPVPVPVPAARAVGDRKGKGKARADVVEEIEAEGSQTKRSTKIRGKKRRPANEDDDEVDTAAVPPAKRGKPSSNAAQRRDVDAEREPAPVPRALESGKRRVKAPAEGAEDIAEEMRLPEKSTTKKRKNEDDNNDSRPRKAAKVADAGSHHPSSAKLKENHPTSVPHSKPKRDERDTLPLKQSRSEKPPSRTKVVKGPPRDVLERIKASAAQHRRLADSEPDELDCLA